MYVSAAWTPNDGRFYAFGAPCKKGPRYLSPYYHFDKPKPGPRSMRSDGMRSWEAMYFYRLNFRSGHTKLRKKKLTKWPG